MYKGSRDPWHPSFSSTPPSAEPIFVETNDTNRRWCLRKPPTLAFFFTPNTERPPQPATEEETRMISSSPCARPPLHARRREAAAIERIDQRWWTVCHDPRRQSRTPLRAPWPLSSDPGPTSPLSLPLSHARGLLLNPFLPLVDMFLNLLWTKHGIYQLL
jgi:hypothetical protein